MFFGVQTWIKVMLMEKNPVSDISTCFTRIQCLTTVSLKSVFRLLVVKTLVINGIFAISTFQTLGFIHQSR